MVHTGIFVKCKKSIGKKVGTPFKYRMMSNLQVSCVAYFLFIQSCFSVRDGGAGYCGGGYARTVGR